MSYALYNGLFGNKVPTSYQAASKLLAEYGSDGAAFRERKACWVLALRFAKLTHGIVSGHTLEITPTTAMTFESPKDSPNKAPRPVEGIEKRKAQLETLIATRKRDIQNMEEEIARLNSGDEQEHAIELLGSFTTPDQIGELNFRELTAKPLFNGNYYLYGSEDFKKIAENPFPVTNVQGGEYQNAHLHWSEKDESIMAETMLEPMLLDEWKYLFSQMTEEQLLGSTTFYVKFDDGIRALRTSFHRRGGGPYNYSVEVVPVRSETSIEKDSAAEPKIVFRKNKLNKPSSGPGPEALINSSEQV